MPTDLMGIFRSSFSEASRQPEGWWHSPTETSPLCRDVALPSTAVLTLWLCLRHLCWPPFLCTPTSFSLEDSIPGSHFITPATLPGAVSWVQKTSLPSEMSEQCSELKKALIVHFKPPLGHLRDNSYPVCPELNVLSALQTWFSSRTRPLSKCQKKKMRANVHSLLPCPQHCASHIMSGF